MIKKFYLLFLILTVLSSQIFSNAQDEEFVQSFIDHYDFRVEGRYTHEYHRFLLNKTSKSFLELEDRLKKEGMGSSGRIVVAGYEEEAVPSYYTDYRRARIDDEATSLGNAGWTLRLHNRFGLMTGFLFKDFNYLSNLWHKDEDSKFIHINPNRVEIFKDESGIFQQHAFGEAYDLLLDYKDVLERKFKNNDPKLILQILKHFWKDLYSNELKTSSRQLAATQDILFSVEYSDYILNSGLPILKYYTGPDITYPIETTIKQTMDATRNAQDFVPVFVSNLKPINNEPTVYVFDSFVDGVGKSTMLGNVKNWIKFGSDIDRYQRVDNSSSQYAEVFKFDDNVFIADLPAQISHFTYKPDGYVYVSAETEFSAEELKNLRDFVRENKSKLLDNYLDLCIEILHTIKQRGIVESFFDEGSFSGKFVRNLFLLKRHESNEWVPFEKEGSFFLFNCSQPTQIRILLHLESVSSYGLKNIEVEQMIFEGVNLSASYDMFLDDFVEKLKTQNVRHVLFVDFLSMYSRSSRENIRINYLVQQLALLDLRCFDFENSFYKNFVSGPQLYAHFIYPRAFDNMLNAFQLEVLLRLVLFKLIDGRVAKELEPVKLSTLTSIAKERVEDLKTGDKGLAFCIANNCEKKLLEEKESLKRLFGKSKEFVNLWKFSFEAIYRFSEILRKFFSETLVNKRLNHLWGELGSDLFDKLQSNYDGEVNGVLSLENGCDIVALYKFSPECKDVNALTPFFRKFRCCWYMLAANLLESKVDGVGNLILPDEKHKINPLLLKIGKEDGQVYLIQKLLNRWESEVPPLIADCRIFNIRSGFKFGEFLGEAYCLNYDNDGTNFGAFAFDCNVSSKLAYGKTSVVSQIVKAYQEENGTGTVMPSSQLYEKLSEDPRWVLEKERMIREASQNGEYGKSEDKNNSGMPAPRFQRMKIFQGRRQQEVGARLIVRMLATLEMILKDIEADVVVRTGNKKDFVAALKLFEEVTLPKYFGVLFQKPLFDDYSTVEPILPWDYFEDNFKK